MVRERWVVLTEAPWSIKPQEFTIWPHTEKVCQLLSLKNYQVLSYIHSDTLVPRAGIDTNRHRTPCSGESQKYRTKHKINTGLGSWSGGPVRGPSKVNRVQEDPARPTLFSGGTAQYLHSFFGEKRFLSHTNQSEREMDCVCNRCSLENTYSSWKCQQARILPGSWAHSSVLRREFLPLGLGWCSAPEPQTSGCAARQEKGCLSRATFLKTWTWRKDMEWTACSWPKCCCFALRRWNLNSQEEKNWIITNTNLRLLYRWTKNWNKGKYKCMWSVSFLEFP